MLNILNKKITEQSDTPRHLPGVNFSKGLSNEEEDFIKAMNGYNNSTQTPMLVDKICVLTHEIKKLNKATTIFSTALAIFAIVQIIVMLL